MNYLAIDTSGKHLTVTVCKNGENFTYYNPDCGVDHSTSLMRETEKLLQEADFDLQKADFLCAVTGAGSFTGIRIGVSAIKAACFAFNLPVLGVTSFDVLAYNKQAGKYLAVIDAKHGCYYVCGYDNRQIVLEPCFIDKVALAELNKEYTLICGEPIEGFKCETVSIKDGLIAAVNAKAEKKTSDLDGLCPLYIRKSQAEEGR